MEGRGDKMQNLFKKVLNKADICDIVRMRKEDICKIIVMTCLGSVDLRKAIREEENRRTKAKREEITLAE